MNPPSAYGGFGGQRSTPRLRLVTDASSRPAHGRGRARVVIVGAGIAGIAVARALRARAPDVEIVVLEASNRIGGNLRSEHIDGYLCEAGPDGFLDNAPATLALVDGVGLTPQLLPSRDEGRRRFIYRHGRLHEVPQSAGAFLRTSLLSAGAKLRVACEPLTGRTSRNDESIRQFAERHIGREAAHVLVGAMISGIFAGDPAELSLGACFPKMRDMEAEFGSLFRAMLAKRRARRNGQGIGAPAGRLTSFTDGMESLVRAAALSLGSSVVTNCRVTELCPRWDDAREDGLRPVGARTIRVVADNRTIEADAVVLAGPAGQSANLVRPFVPEAARLLNGIQTAPLAVVCLGYDERALLANRGPLNGFGFLIPRDEGPRILGAMWETSIYAGRAPAGKALLRVMVGGATDRGAVDLGDAEMLDVVLRDLRLTMGLGIAPAFIHVFRHRGGIPQYTIGHNQRLERINDHLRGFGPGLFLAGNSYRGVSINACIQDAPGVAHLVAVHLQTVPGLHATVSAR